MEYPMYCVEDTDFIDFDDYLDKAAKLVLFLSECIKADAIIYGLLPWRMSWLVTNKEEYIRICKKYGLSGKDYLWG